MTDNGTYLEDRSTLTMRAMEKYAGKPQKGLDKLDISYDINRKTKLCLVMCPEWDPSFPPYNIARLSGVVKSAGYECKSFDTNEFEIHKKEFMDIRNTDLSFSHAWTGKGQWNV